MKLSEINTTIRDALRDLKKLDLPDGAAALLSSITAAGNHLPDISRAMDTREADNAKLREQVKELEGQLPTGDKVVLDKADADALEAYRAIGQLEEVKLKTAGFDEAIATATQLKQAAVLDAASRDPDDETKFRYKPSVLEGLLRLKGATLEATDKGHQVKAGDNTTTLDTWLTENAGDFAPALQATSTTSSGKQASRQAGDRTEQPKTLADTDKIKARRASSGDYAI